MWQLLKQCSLGWWKKYEADLPHWLFCLFSHLQWQQNDCFHSCQTVLLIDQQYVWTMSYNELFFLPDTVRIMEDFKHNGQNIGEKVKMRELEHSGQRKIFVVTRKKLKSGNVQTPKDICGYKNHIKRNFGILRAVRTLTICQYFSRNSGNFRPQIFSYSPLCTKNKRYITVRNKPSM